MIREAIDRETRPGTESIESRSQQSDLLTEGRRLYENYGRPLEHEHWGKFVAIARDGRTVLGETSLGVLERAKMELGPRNFVFKVGEVTLGKLR